MTTTYWLVIGFIGQIAFGARFVIQWLVSEKKGESTIPIASVSYTHLTLPTKA